MGDCAMINDKPLIEFISEAIHELAPNSTFSVVGDSLDKDGDGGLRCVRWSSVNTTKEPKAEQVISKIEELKQRFVNSQYQRKRAPEYPSIGDQLDDLFKAGLFSEQMAAKIQAIKDKYPKPE